MIRIFPRDLPYTALIYRIPVMIYRIPMPLYSSIITCSCWAFRTALRAWRPPLRLGSSHFYNYPDYFACFFWVLLLYCIQKYGVLFGGSVLHVSAMISVLTSFKILCSMCALLSLQWLAGPTVKRLQLLQSVRGHEFWVSRWVLLRMFTIASDFLQSLQHEHEIQHEILPQFHIMTTVILITVASLSWPTGATYLTAVNSLMGDTSLALLSSYRTLYYRTCTDWAPCPRARTFRRTRRARQSPSQGPAIIDCSHLEAANN